MNHLMLVVAYVRRARRVAVGQALRMLSLTGWSESDVVGHGDAADGHGVDHVRFEIVVPAKRARQCTRAIADAARTGAKGDGLVLTLPVASVEQINAPAEEAAAAQPR